MMPYSQAFNQGRKGETISTENTTATRSNHEPTFNIFKPSNKKIKNLPKNENSNAKNTSTGGKSKKRTKELKIQKTLITSFFEPKKSGLETGGGVEQCQINNSNSKQAECSSDVGGVGRLNPGAVKGVGDRNRLVTFSFTTSTTPAQRRPSGMD